MIKNKILKIVCAAALMGVSGVATAQEPLIIRNDAVVVCRSKQCKSARNMMTQEFLYNKLGSLLKNNINRRVLFCDADSNVHVCLNDAITFGVKAGATDTQLHIPSAIIVDSKSMPDEMAHKFVIDYDMQLGETYPSCQASLNQMRVVSADEINVEVPGFECRFTENGMSVVNASYEVDYIDFDYGILGAHYSFAVGQVSTGGQSGYALLRFSDTANENNEVKEDCGCSEQQNPPCQCEQAEPEVKTIIQEKVVTQYEVAPIEVYVKTKAPIEAGQVQSVRINGVDVPNVPVVADAPVQQPVEAEPEVTQPAPEAALQAGVPVIMEVEEIIIDDVK